MSGLTSFNKSDKYFNFQCSSALAEYWHREWASGDCESEVISLFRWCLQVVLIPPSLKGLEWHHLPQKQTQWVSMSTWVQGATWVCHARVHSVAPWQLQRHLTQHKSNQHKQHKRCQITFNTTSSSGTAGLRSVQSFTHLTMKWNQKEKEAAAD